MILLFDIDGTLVRCGGAGRAALERAFSKLHGVPSALASVRLDGNTDPAIVEAAFQSHLGRSPTAVEVDTLMDTYFADLEVALSAEGSPYEVLAGVPELLEALSALRDKVVMGLATGNHERGARAKLEPAKLNRYFSFGGFGSDHAVRARLVERGLERGRELARRTLGRDVPSSEAWVFGDTELDVRAAHLAGARAVGVLHGSSNRVALADARPDLLIEDFRDPRLWSHLGLGDPPSR